MSNLENSTPQNASGSQNTPAGSLFSLRYWREMSNESMPKIILISVVLCIVCSFFVSFSAISLRDMQEKNKLDSKRNNIVQVAGLADQSADLDMLFEQYIDTRLVDIDAGVFAEFSGDAEAMVSTEDPDLSRPLTLAEDIAKIKVRENFAVVYLVKDDNGVYDKIILPIRGYGLWSTLYGFVAIDAADRNTVQALQFYDQAETPGLGAEVDNPRWRALWQGKRVYDDDGVALGVAKGDQSNNAYKVDGLSGATLTSRGVNNLVQFWLGPLGFEPLLRNLNTLQ